MIKTNRFLYKVGFIIVIGFFSILVFIFSTTNNNNDDNISFLLLNQNSLGEITDAKLFIVNHLKLYVHVYNINIKVVLPQGTKEIRKLRPSFIKKRIQKIFEFTDLGLLTLTEKNKISLLDSIGGVYFLNTSSTNYSNGPIIISKENYYEFLNGITSPVLKIDTAYSLWYNLLFEGFQVASEYRKSEEFAKNIFSFLSFSSFSKKEFLKFFLPIIKNNKNVYCTYSRMNIIKENEQLRLLNNGNYDKKKFLTIFKEFNKGEKDLELFSPPPSLQVVNTTPINRLAAKTSGILRLRKCNTKEYLNSQIPIKNSLIIDRCGSVVKREYLKKITRIKHSIYYIDYREDFDFTLYLAEDYYAIKFITNRK